MHAHRRRRPTITWMELDKRKLTGFMLGPWGFSKTALRLHAGIVGQFVVAPPTPFFSPFFDSYPA
ncbi:unnamed protein product [Trifolium pratense]|uniref:Uncharacterized protein n=2 Tax=Trifolium pratense TaxID=57577 RepID=A0ACB0K4K2_TRIPR|nr:unnamed protein product [Trifolium pratense]CAJ2651219.1 unnamed protein product [Trifolium pratense]